MKLKLLYKRYIRIIPGIRSYALAAALVFVLGMTVTIMSWYVDRQRIDTQKISRLNDQIAMVEGDIENRLTIYEQILRGIHGLYSASDSVDQASIRNFVRQYDLQSSYPGIQSIGVIEHVKAENLPQYLEKMRGEGYPNIAVTPAGERPDYALLTYAEPLTERGRASIGFDVLTDPTRASLAAQVRDTGDVSISNKLVLLSDRMSASSQAGFTMYTAIYNKNAVLNNEQARRDNLRGYVFAGYRAESFFKQTIKQNDFTAYKDVQIFDGKSTNPKDLLYQTADFSSFNQEDVSPAFESTNFNRTWTFRFAGPLGNASEDTQRSNMILIGGTTLSVAIAGFLFLIMLTRARAIVYAKQNEAQQSKDDLLSLASHQLRTPATAVKQYLGMILEGYTGKVNKNQLPAIEKAYLSNERQLDTINQILYVAKADAGRLSINRSEFDINALVKEIMLDVKDSLAENKQKVVLKASAKKLKIYADEASMRMVVENLISNASKYSYKGSKITIKTGKKSSGGVFVMVCDEGVGIAPDDFDKLFKKFSRIDNDLSLQVGGTGIGLYIDKVLIELHGGKIDIASEPGQGSTFTIWIPDRRKTDDNLTDEGG